MGIYKLTSPCTIVDIYGNVVDTEKTIVFDNKKELIEYLSGDTDGDNYGSSLIRIKDFDKKLYEDLGRVCSQIAYRLQQDDEQKTARICEQIINYMMFPTAENAKKLYPILRETRLPFLNNCYFSMMDTDIDGELPWEEEYCNKLMGMIRTDPTAFAAVLAHASNCVIDAWKERESQLVPNYKTCKMKD